MGATRELAAYVVSARHESIPADVRHEAHRALLNYVGCAVGGAREPAVDIAIRALATVLRPADCTGARASASASIRCTHR